MLSLALLAIAAYAATNVDNLFVLLAFLADARGRWRPVITGQCVGSAILIAGAIVLAALLKQLPTGYAGLLGILPIVVGLVKAWERFGRAKPGAREPINQPPTTQATAASGSSWRTVASMAIVNGSDNLAVYVPLYATHSHSAGLLISLVFVAMIALWCAVSVWLVEHPLLGAPIRRYGTALLPFILLLIGVSVVAKSGILSILPGN